MAENTRELLLDTAFELFYQHGYHATGLTAILKKAGLFKGSLYHLFESKQALALAVMDERIHKRIENKYATLLEAGSNYLPRLFTKLRDPQYLNIHLGCPLNRMMQELGREDEIFHKALLEVYSNFEKRIEDILYSAIACGEFFHPAPDKLAIFVTASIEGAITSGRQHSSFEHYLCAINELENYLELLQS
jgi:AcrR family transcriptional regulator